MGDNNSMTKYTDGQVAARMKELKEYVEGLKSILDEEHERLYSTNARLKLAEAVVEAARIHRDEAVAWTAQTGGWHDCGVCKVLLDYDAGKEKS